MDNLVLAAALRAAANVLDPQTAKLETLTEAVEPVAAAKETVKPAKPKAAKAAAPATIPETVAVAPAVIPAATTATQSAAVASVAPQTIAPPTDIQATAIAFKTLVTSKGRAAGVALLKSFGAELMSQIPPAKLAEFKVACDKGAQAPDAPAVEDPTAGLLN